MSSRIYLLSFFILSVLSSDRWDSQSDSLWVVLCFDLHQMQTKLGEGKPNGVEQHIQIHQEKKNFFCSYCCYMKNGLLDISWCWIQSVVDLWRGFWAKLLVHKQRWRVLINVNWCVNGHCDLWKTPLWESRGCSLILFCVLFLFFFSSQCFQKVLPQQKRSAALSSEWLNNSGGSDFSRTSLRLCLWSDTTQGFDTLKTLLRIWLCTQKRMVKSGSGRRRRWMMALMFSPKHLTCTVKSSSHEVRQQKSFQGFSQGSTVRFVLLKALSLSQFSADCLWQNVLYCMSSTSRI